MSEAGHTFVGQVAAIPDWFKLSSTIQTDPNGFWWKDSKCDLCEYEASYLGPEGYRCYPHKPCFTDNNTLQP